MLGIENISWGEFLSFVVPATLIGDGIFTYRAIKGGGKEDAPSKREKEEEEIPLIEGETAPEMAEDFDDEPENIGDYEGIEEQTDEASNEEDTQDENSQTAEEPSDAETETSNNQDETDAEQTETTDNEVEPQGVEVDESDVETGASDDFEDYSFDSEGNTVEESETIETTEIDYSDVHRERTDVPIGEYAEGVEDLVGSIFDGL